ncbi:MAG TPA: glycosyltransferase family 4 protein [Rhodothermales bacterium]|nr:glycosyltransferase family 4 protein [Rhodothermales bacterium]
MRILIHDYAGHPFQVQLSRELARRGHDVLHAYCASLQTTPRGRMENGVPPTDQFQIHGIQLDRPLQKFSFTTRWRQENEYGRLLAGVAEGFRPDVVLSGNTPLDAQRRLMWQCQTTSTRFIYWVQDLLGVATHRILSRRSHLLGNTIGRYYTRLERDLLRASDGVVLVTDDFRPIMADWSVSGDVRVIENWAPLDEVPVRPKDNPWSRKNGLVDKTCLLYAGTLGMKHNPELLLRLATRFRNDSEVRVVVISQGLGADWLRARKAEMGLENLVLLPFQDFADMPDALATGDVLLAILEPEAGIFSVPSKVLTYLCAGRPTLLAVPAENLAARLVRQSNTGIVVSPDDASAFVHGAERLIRCPRQRCEMGRAARSYAESRFCIASITDAFEQILLA